MNDFHEPLSKAGDPGADDAAVIAAILRIGTSLDLKTVLREAVERARALNDARYGATYALTVPDSALDLRHFLPHA